MQTGRVLAGAIVLAAAVPSSLAAQQPQPQSPQPYSTGNPLGLPVSPAGGATFEPMSPNVKVFGAVVFGESCSYDPARNVIVVPNRGNPQNVQANDAFVSFINHDGSVHTPRWIGIQSPADRARLTPALVLNDPLGSDITGGVLYVADRDGGTSSTDAPVAVIRKFEMRTGAPAGEIRFPGVDWLNDLEVADDGTIYATRTGAFGENPDANTWQLWKVAPNGAPTVVVQGAPLFQPNGVAFDPQGNVVVVNIGDANVLTFSTTGKLLRTEQAVQPGNDGLVIMPDGTKYVSSVRNGGVSRIRPGRPAELIARNIPSAASMCYDPVGKQLVIPMNPNNGLAFLKLEQDGR